MEHQSETGAGRYPSPFTSASSAELFQALGATIDESERMERGLEAVVRREQIKHDNSK